MVKKQTNLTLQIILPLVVILLIGCAKAQIKVLSPAEIDTKGIKTVAVGKFEVADIQEKFKSERKGIWVNRRVPLTDEQKKIISRAVRARVINLLTTTPYFKVTYTDEFAALENDAALQQLISTQGYKTQDVEAVINGKIWIEIERADGAEMSKVELEYFQPPRGERDPGLNLTVEQLVWWPYKNARGTLALELKMTRLNPTEVIAVTFDTRSYAHKLGGKPAGTLDQVSGALSQAADFATKDKKKGTIESSDMVMPSFDQMIADMAVSIAANFVKRVAATEKVVGYSIAGGGDENARILIEAGAYNMAIEQLQRVTATDPNPDDLYNLGLCFEAKGDFGLALTFYREAFNADREAALYAQGIGRIEKIQRERPRLRKQIQEKKQ